MASAVEDGSLYKSFSNTSNKGVQSPITQSRRSSSASRTGSFFGPSPLNSPSSSSSGSSDGGSSSTTEHGLSAHSPRPPPSLARGGGGGGGRRKMRPRSPPPLRAKREGYPPPGPRPRAGSSGSSSSDDSLDKGHNALNSALIKATVLNKGHNALSSALIKGQWLAMAREASGSSIVSLGGGLWLGDRGRSYSTSSLAETVGLGGGGLTHLRTYVWAEDERASKCCGCARPFDLFCRRHHCFDLRTYVWAEDERASKCCGCARAFDLFCRRHHWAHTEDQGIANGDARGCGRIFCAGCSDRRLLVLDPLSAPGRRPADPRVPHRVCGRCYRDMLPSQAELIASISNAQRYNPLDEPAGAHWWKAHTPLAFTLGHEVRRSARALNRLAARLEASAARLQRRRGEPVACGCGGGGSGGGGAPAADALRADGHALLRGDLLAGARGIAVLGVLRAGFVCGAAIGRQASEFHIALHRSTAAATSARAGLCVARLPDGSWSAPSAVWMGGVSWGLQGGGGVTDYLLVLHNDAALELFQSRDQVSIGVEAGLALGGHGRQTEAALSVATGSLMRGQLREAQAMTAYSISKGLFAGLSVEARVVASRPGVNERFYGMQVDAGDLLRGKVTAPLAASALYEALSRVDRLLHQDLFAPPPPSAAPALKNE
ncbi:hypothetical protein JKP88DRAFT_350835 [Tribonema minus]|uniref:FYVE-type domain-containing protein n=1 Tax=Tribonema minus TaxID=303371 RepID=A0A835YKQ4_9STRA|nr:hypothetical protein JKP88DRAFT_350835 [Tribonema minus]